MRSLEMSCLRTARSLASATRASSSSHFTCVALLRDFSEIQARCQQRLLQQETLSFIASCEFDERILLLCLDSFRKCGNVESFGNSAHRQDRRRTADISREFCHD